MRGRPVVTAEEMKRLEAKAFEEGASAQEYMEQAGRGVAHVLEEFLITPQAADTVYLLIGKGNNGGDAFVVGHQLLQKGFSVKALHLFALEECSPLCAKMGKRYIKAGGAYEQIYSVPDFEKGVIVDGLVGTGFKGEAKGFLAELIEGANKCHLPIFAIDIPSGLNATTGEVGSVAIQAQVTVSLGLPKLGFFIGQGWNHVGVLLYVDFGLPKKLIQEAQAQAYLISEEKASLALPKLERSRHKYQAGYVIAVAGSARMPGAALLSCLAALKAGAGIVRLFYPPGMKEEVASAPYELIKEEWDLKDDTRIFEEEKRSKALLIGPGMGRGIEAESAVKMLLAKTTLPTVVDADALYVLSQNPEMTLPEHTILTPHHQEMVRILKADPTLTACTKYAKERNLTLVLKGAPTVIFYPNAEPLIVPHGDPGMASAGTGDVLTGIIAALLAQGERPYEAASLGVLLHALAGELAAASETSYCVIASDLIRHLAGAFDLLLEEKE